MGWGVQVESFCVTAQKLGEFIVEYLDDKKKTFQRLVEKAEKSVRLLKERRTALISAAVTGKIDVRNAV